MNQNELYHYYGGSELYHYGVKGMKWRDRRRVIRQEAKRLRKENNKAAKDTYLDAQTKYDQMRAVDILNKTVKWQSKLLGATRTGRAMGMRDAHKESVENDKILAERVSKDKAAYKTAKEDYKNKKMTRRAAKKLAKSRLKI